MMKKVFLLLALLTLVVSCSLDDDGRNVSYEFVPIAKYELPDSLVFGKNYEFPISYVSPTDCNAFYGFEYDRRDSTRLIFIVNQVLESENCLPTTDTVETTLNFEVLYNYTYVFKFFNGFDANDEPTYITEEVPVKRP
ncbi:hypothetical protein DSM00_182 [Leeuwenhoekiella aequorea]|uniref:Lipoprotein n=2 Tax=Leeuwenhoekiella aequorea TaxID=283736 RepID=A0A4Q0PC82_9FLAO|nr:hypothetical protein DSM00_182 [Leeuwenhoekiella aequorea]